MTPEIKDFTNWADAERWLSRHGWGLGLIEQQKLFWDAAQELKAKVAEPVKVAEPAIKK